MTAFGVKIIHREEIKLFCRRAREKLQGKIFSHLARHNDDATSAFLFLCDVTAPSRARLAKER